MAQDKNKEQCEPTTEEEKRKRDMAILEELTELEKLRRRHNLTFVGQEEGDIANRAADELTENVDAAEKCLDDEEKKKKE